MFVALFMSACVVVTFTHAATSSTGSSGTTTPTTLFFGATPMGSTVWTAEGGNSITVDTSTAHLQLTAVPTYVTRVITRNTQYASTDLSFQLDQLANISGVAVPKSPTDKGFKIRLRSTDPAKNVSTITAKSSDFRVVWMAATSKHAGLENHTPNSVGAHAELVRQMLNEDPLIMKGFFAPGEVQPMLRNIPVPKPPVNPKRKDNNSTTTNKTTKDEKKTGGDRSS